MRTVFALAAVAFAASTTSLALAGKTQDAEKIGKTFRDVKMSVTPEGNPEPMSAGLRPTVGGVSVIITEGGNTSPKTVRIVDGECPGTNAKVLYTLPPFHGNEYQSIAKGAKIDDLFAGKKALLVVGSTGRKATDYACGNLSTALFQGPAKLK